MNKFGLLHFKRSIARLGRRFPKLPRAAVRNLMMFWLLVVFGAIVGAVWTNYVRNNEELLRFAQEEWQAGVDKIGQLVPEAVAYVAEQKSWVQAALNSALPRRAATEDGEGRLVGKRWGVAEEDESGWRRVLDLAMSIALGYDVSDRRALLMTAVPAVSMTEKHPLASPDVPLAAGERLIDEGSGDLTPVASDEPFSSASPKIAAVGPPAIENRTQAVMQPTPVDVPGPPVPEPPKERVDEVQAASATADRLRDSLPSVSGPADGCRILIFHTHTSETYRSDTFAPAEAGNYHLWNSTESGIVQVGRAMKRALEERFGIPTCHLTTIHDWPSHARAYVESRGTVERFLRQNPQVELVLDVHRDSPSGLTTTVGGRSAAQVAAVVGTHPTMHPQSASNVAVAFHIGRLIDERYPGLFRRVIERPDARLNQDLHPRAIILEIGSYDTHLDAALETGNLLADVLADTLRWIRTTSGATGVR